MAYKRIYSDKVKTYLQAIGLVGVPLLFGVFMYLNAMGDITITGHSGDVTCFGTVDDPCYAYINFTANKDIYIYPIPKEDKIWVFGTNATIKEIIFQRSWGNSWRTIDLNKTWDNNVKYAIKFSNGQNYQLRFIGYKNNPTDVVKWSFADLDPKWDAYKPDDFFTKLIENKADLTSGYAIFEVYNPLSQQINIDTSKLNISYQKFKGNEITKMEYFILKNMTTTNNITEYKTVCDPYNITIPENFTIVTIDNCTTSVSGWHIESRTSEEWVKFNTLALLPKIYYKFKIVGYWRAHLGNQSIEWFPRMNVIGIDYVQNKWAWWDADWDYKAQVNITANRMNEPISIIMNDISGFLISQVNANCSDVRLINSTENGELLFQLINGGGTGTICNATHVILATLGNTTASPILGYLYWGNAGASTTTSNVTMRYFRDDFEDNTISNMLNWTYGSTAKNCMWDEVGGTLRQNSTGCGFVSGAVYLNKVMINSTLAVSQSNGIIITLWNSTPFDGDGKSGRIQIATRINDVGTPGRGYDFLNENNNRTWMFLNDGVAWGSGSITTTLSNSGGQNRQKFKIVGTGLSAKIWNSSTSNEPGAYQITQTWTGRSTGKFGFDVNTLGGAGYTTPTIWFHEIELWNVSYDPNMSAIPSTVVLGAEESQAVAGTPNISVTLNTPNDLATVTSNPVSHVFTPTSYGDSIYNCSVYTNASGSWALNVTNTSAITNASANTISVSYPSNAAYLWNVECWNSTTSVFASANRTFTLTVATDTCTPTVSGNWEIDCNDNCILSDDEIVIDGDMIIYSTDTGNVTFDNCNVTMVKSKLNATDTCFLNRTCSGICVWNETG